MHPRNGSSLTAVFSTLLLLLPRQASAAPGQGIRRLESQELSIEGTQICTGMLEGFLHKASLTNDDKECMVTSLGDVISGVFESAENVVSLLRQPPASQMGPAKEALQLAESLQGFVRILDGAMMDCVEGPAQKLLVKAGEHLRNGTYVEGHFIANSVDIVKELADAITHFQQNELHEFGQNIGTACRKVLLSNSSREVLPEGPPSPEQIINVSVGILQGFFGEGFELDISSDQQIMTAPPSRTMELIEALNRGETVHLPEVPKGDREHVHVHINLHSCVSKNLALFRAVLQKSIFYCAQTLMQQSQDAPDRFFDFVLSGLPGAFERCGITPEQQMMLADSVQSLRHVRLKLRLPDGDVDIANRASKHLQSVVADWSHADWFSMGSDLGLMLQGLVLEAFPEKYMTSTAGNLRRHAEEDASRVAAAVDEELPRVPVVSDDELARGGFSSADQPGVGTGFSRHGVQLITGLAEGFLHHPLSRDEQDCLLSSAGEAMGGAEVIATTLGDAFNAMVSDQLEEQDFNQLFGEVKRSLDSVLRLQEGFLDKCAQKAGPALQALENVSQHILDMQYITGQIVANGAVLLEDIDRSIAAMKQGNPHTFGLNMGRAFRKVFLSKPVTGTHLALPEGNATLAECVNVSAGLLEGFFGAGFELDISSDKKIATMPIMNIAALISGDFDSLEEEEPKRLRVHVDLHSCVKRNLPLFQEIMSGAWESLAAQDFIPLPDGLMQSPVLTLMLMQLPAALGKCGIDEEQQQMLMQSVDALDQLKVKVKVPHDGQPMSFERGLEHLKRVIQDWSRLQWFDLGKDLGQLLREALIASLPELFSVDSLGILQRNSVGHARAPRTGPAPPFAAVALFLALLGIAGGAALRARRRSRGPRQEAGLSLHQEDSEAALAQPQE